MTSFELRECGIIATLLNKYPKRISSIEISPMGLCNFSRDVNYNMLVQFDTTICQMFTSDFLLSCFNINVEKDSKWMTKYMERMNYLNRVMQDTRGAKFIKANSPYEYMCKLEIMVNLLIAYDKTGIVKSKLIIKDHEMEDCKVHQIACIKRECFNNEKNGVSQAEINSYKLNLERDLALDRLQFIDYLNRCDNAYNNKIIGKIRSGTALTRQEIEKNTDLIEAYKEMIKLKAATSNTTETIEV